MLALDLAGVRFGRLTAIRVADRHPRTWLCKCDCGGENVVAVGDLRRGRSTSCGCNVRTHGYARKGRKPPEYAVWCGMWARCKNPNAPQFPGYGGRGIGVCDEWRDFARFLADMGPRPSGSHSIERINNDGDYWPGNCRWAEAKQQARNRRNNRLIKIGGETLCLAEWAERAGISRAALGARIKRGIPLSAAIKLKKYQR